MSLPLVETFYSLQGEGSCVGRPSVFIRLGGCNFKCVGFGVRANIEGQEFVGCDSIYAVRPNAKWQYLKNAEDLLAKLPPHNLESLPLIVLTGGEPSLHFKNPILLKALQILHERGHTLWVESNGSVFFDFSPPLDSLHFTLSPKLSFSGEQTPLKPLQHILDNALEVVFKFVLKSPTDIQEVQALLKNLRFKTPPLIYLMPLAIDQESLQEGLESLASVCLAHGYSLGQRLHIQLWGNAPGR
ncbi:7-carboxy-7-deazaguanine synthase [Helicobacter sp. NHP19-003]|uniref:7-carboxy-7-deazaguanine synthase n=1 Tax=Helicobacter gastrocanis TaxID=2849641 RepID=A0ABM7S8L2_9HELI|nr:7-carboxy-7-deazaguanine synthase QueE [Helicobacter sp. NHP19-003]BCZ16910.1 7-carboxy-7-deazaguanine synthase [Helicobacter sp. NHP19-003]